MFWGQTTANPDAGRAPAERVQRDVLAAERQLREQAEAEHAALQDLLRELAARFWGLSVETELRADPYAFRRWSTARWRQFFDALPAALPWANHQVLLAERDAARQQVTQLQTELEQWRTAPVAPRSAVSMPLPSPRKSVERALTLTQGYAALPWPVIPATPPARFAPLIPLSGDRWTQAALALWLLAAQGWPLPVEIRRLLMQRAPQASAHSAEEAANTLCKVGLARLEKFDKVIPRDGGIATSVTVLALTDLGRDLAWALGWPVARSEYEQLGEAGINTPVMFGVGLLFAHYARMRGYVVTLDGHCAQIAKAEETTRVQLLTTVEDLAAVLAPGELAVCAATPSGREAVFAHAQATRQPGRATDLQTLSTAPPDTFWLARWD